MCLLFALFVFFVIVLCLAAVFDFGFGFVCLWYFLFVGFACFGLIFNVLICFMFVCLL